MIIKGASRAGARALGQYLSHQGKNERIEVVEVRGTIDQTPAGALIEMDAYAAGTRCEKSIYHAIINPEPPHRLSPEQRIEAVDALESKLGLEGHARVVVMHEKDGRQHLHVAWSRIDVDEMRSVSDSHNYRKHEEVARDLERRFGHDRVQGAHAERDSADGEKIQRPDRTPSRAERQQEEKTGITGKDVKAEVTALYRASDGPPAFKAALEEHGYTLANGDRRDFVLVDAMGGVHSLARRIDGVKTVELRDWMKDLDRGSLPTVAEAQRDRKERIDNFAHDDSERLDGSFAEPAVAEQRLPNSDWEPAQTGALDHSSENAGRSVEKASLLVIDAATNATTKLADYLADFFGGGSGPDPDKSQAALIIAERRAAAALESIRDCLTTDRAIGVDDVRCLRPDDIRNIKDHGDDYLREMVARLESQRVQERELERGRERER